MARGQAAGIHSFGNTNAALAASMAPLIAFPLVGSVLVGISGQPKLAAIAFLSRLCIIMSISVITYEYARLIGRQHHWLRTATAINWSFWLLIPLLLIAGILGSLMVAAGVAETSAENILIGFIAGYMLWYHIFIVRSSLLLKTLPAAGLVIITNLSIAALAFGPDLVARAINGHGV